jgi:hypothetical protein
MRGAILPNTVIKVSSLEIEDVTMVQRVVGKLEKGHESVTLEFHNVQDRKDFTNGFVEKYKPPNSDSDAHNFELELEAQGYTIKDRDYGSYYVTYKINKQI